MSLQLDMCRVEVELEKASREWQLEAAENALEQNRSNSELRDAVRAAKANLDLWKDYINLLYPTD